jgi:Spy/CpxP family protein refolding chaperone
MKKYFIALAVVLCLTVTVRAQSTEKEEIDAMQANFGIQKKELIVELIKMTPDQSKKFWPLYDAYEDERKALGKERIQMIKNLSEAYEHMTPEKADAVAMQSIKLAGKYESLMEKYYKSIKANVGSEVGLEFYQAETYLLTVVRMTLMNEVPLFSNVKKTK